MRSVRIRILTHCCSLVAATDLLLLLFFVIVKSSWMNENVHYLSSGCSHADHVIFVIIAQMKWNYTQATTTATITTKIAQNNENKASRSEHVEIRRRRKRRSVCCLFYNKTKRVFLSLYVPTPTHTTNEIIK